MAVASSAAHRVSLDGKFFRLGGKKFYLKGLSYGPFAPNLDGDHFASPAQTVRDFAALRELGANVLRTYEVPPAWFLDLAAENDLRLLVDIPWNKQVCFLESAASQTDARAAVQKAASECARHPAVFALSVVNEIPADIVRWSGADAVAGFIDELVEVVRDVEPECLCTFGAFPTTEFLRPHSVDFLCFNVYLHQPRPFENYLARLQMLADAKPLVLGEFGLDSGREGESVQGETLAWQIEAIFRGGLAGGFVYSFSDEWYKDGRLVEDWRFGLTTSDRRPKPSFRAVKQAFAAAPYFPLEGAPTVSVVVASYNGARTLNACLNSLTRLNYPDYEVILVDDGSTDWTQDIVGDYPQFRVLRHETNQGLSVARNTGIAAARGEVIAFTDADCQADEDWLYYLVGDLLKSKYAGIGGLNLLPPDDSWVAAAVMVSPGGPAHVMLTDRLAEHIPGCNMAFYKSALLEIGCFDPIFRKAGDDVDICWRLQERGCRIGFSPAGFVWHHRRSTVGDYLKQQHGYGEAEALLVRKHPEYFNAIGGNIWRGRIYSSAKFGILLRRPMIYHGLFGAGLFQTLYAARPAPALAFFTSLEYHVLVTVPLLVMAPTFTALAPLAVTSLLMSYSVCVIAARQEEIHKRKQRLISRPLVALLYFLQPIVRAWARYQGHLSLHQSPLSAKENLDSLSLKSQGRRFDEVHFWDEHGTDRMTFLTAVLDQLEKRGWPNKADAGWQEFDLEIFGSRWSRLQLTTVTEAHALGKQLIRCRLRPRWSLLARASFWSTVGLELLLIGFAWRAFPWLWTLLLSLLVFAWWLQREQRDLQRLIAVFLEETAKPLRLIPVPRVPPKTVADGKPDDRV